MQTINHMESSLAVKKPFISVAIPAYKDAFLAECIESVLAQTYTNYEIVVVNDASPYDLDSIIEKYEDKRIRYYKNEKNYGAVDVVKNWNRCLDLAKGDYIICMGDDDMLMSNCLEDYVKLMAKYPGLGVYHSWSEVIDENSEFKEITAARCEYESAYSLLWHRWNGRRRQFIGDFLFDVKLLRGNGGFFILPLAWGSDEVSSIIAAIPGGIANTQSIGFCYRVNSNTISSTGDSVNKVTAIQGYEKWCDDFLKSEPLDDLDKKFWICLKKQKKNYFNREKAIEIAQDLRSRSIFRILRWYKTRGLYGLDKKVLSFAVFEAIKQKLKSR